VKESGNSVHKVNHGAVLAVKPWSKAVPFLAMLAAVGFPLLGKSVQQSAPGASHQLGPSPVEARDSQAVDPRTQGAEEELQKGIALTRRGSFAEAIPHLVAAHGKVANEYAASFDLALCYVALGKDRQAISLLIELQSAGHDNADVNNLLAQAYVGDSQDQKALEALQKAASLTPSNEKLYMFVADECMGKQAYAQGLRVVNLGLQHLSSSARMHYERAMFLSLLDRFDDARADFALAQKLAPDSDIAFDAGAQQAMLAGDVPAVISTARTGVLKGHQDFMLLALLGEALLRSGATPGQPEFEEARQALEKSIQLRPNYPSSQLALGKLHLIENRLPDAIVHLEIARQLNPDDPAVYSNLATAYRKAGNPQKAQESLVTLARLNHVQAEKIRSAVGDRKAGYGQSEVSAQP
jgi:tetratricopeptide (TPR) repeat protein